MSARLELSPCIKEDFFTQLSFSTLICELGDKENIMMNHLEIKNQYQHKSVVKITKDFDKLLQNSSD